VEWLVSSDRAHWENTYEERAPEKLSWYEPLPQRSLDLIQAANLRPQAGVLDVGLPDGHYHLDRMLKPLVRRGEVACCGTSMDARAITQEQLVEGAHRSTLEELTDWTMWADKTLVF